MRMEFLLSGVVFSKVSLPLNELYYVLGERERFYYFNRIAAVLQ